MHQHVKPSLTYEILIVKSMDLKGKNNKYKGNHNVNHYETLEFIIVQSMELRGKKKKYKSKKNANLGIGNTPISSV